METKCVGTKTLRACSVAQWKKPSRMTVGETVVKTVVKIVVKESHE